MLRVKDSINRIVYINDWTIKACDVDADGNVENIDIIKDDKLVYCVNMADKDNEALCTAIALMFEALTSLM